MISLAWRQARRPQACGPQLGSALHVMLALRCSFREVVVTYEELNGTNIVGKFLGK